jgi:hypothetical protein
VNACQIGRRQCWGAVSDTWIEVHMYDEDRVKLGALYIGGETQFLKCLDW